MDKFKSKYISNVKLLINQLCDGYNIMEDNNMINIDNNRILNTIQKRENLNTIAVLDEPGSGNANHEYGIYNKANGNELCKIQFQNGPRKEENSISGVIDSDLLEIIRDRLKGFQSGDFATEYNSKALEHIEIALMYMNRRVEDRISRNVLGTNNK